MSELPLIMAVDEDSEALQLITAELQRYARDYHVICGPSTEAALEQLEALHDGDKAVAVVLAARGTQELTGAYSQSSRRRTPGPTRPGQPYQAMQPFGAGDGPTPLKCRAYSVEPVP